MPPHTHSAAQRNAGARAARQNLGLCAQGLRTCFSAKTEPPPERASDIVGEGFPEALVPKVHFSRTPSSQVVPRGFPGHQPHLTSLGRGLKQGGEVGPFAAASGQASTELGAFSHQDVLLLGNTR